MSTARKSSPAQSSTAHTHKLWTGFSIFCTIKLVPSSSWRVWLWKSTTEMCKIKTSMKKKNKERLFTISPTTRTRKHKSKHIFTLHIIKLQTHNHGKLWTQKGLDKLTQNSLHSRVTDCEKDRALLHCFLSSFQKVFEVRHGTRHPTGLTRYRNFSAHHNIS